MCDWLTIDEQTPRDGTHFLAWWPEGRWSDDENPELVGAAYVTAFGLRHGDPEFWPTNYEGGLPGGQPTLWKPISPPT